jgi:hypothetical protein
MTNGPGNDDHPQNRHPYRFYWLTAGLATIVATIIGISVTHSSTGSVSNPGPSDGVPSSNPANATTPPATITSSSASTGYGVVYHDKDLIVQAGTLDNCGLGQFVNVDIPKVDQSWQGTDSFGFYCRQTDYEIEPYGHASASVHGKDDPNGCLSAVNSSPVNFSAAVKPGAGFCVKSDTGLIVYVQFVGVDRNGNVTLRLDGWMPN